MSTLQTHDLTKSYGGRTVVRGVSLEVASGEVVGLLGPNGAGKTTTFYMTVGLTAPDATSRLTPRTTVRPPYDLVSSWVWRVAINARAAPGTVHRASTACGLPRCRRR